MSTHIPKMQPEKIIKVFELNRKGARSGKSIYRGTIIRQSFTQSAFFFDKGGIVFWDSVMIEPGPFSEDAYWTELSKDCCDSIILPKGWDMPKDLEIEGQ